MKDRIKQIREQAEEKKLTQSAFGERIGLTRDNVANIEGGRTEPTEIVIKSILREFNVNETWLRTGEGEMLKPKSHRREVAELVQEAQKRTPDQARQSLVDHISKLTDADVILLAEILKRKFPD